MTCDQLLALKNIDRSPTSAELRAAIDHAKSCGNCYAWLMADMELKDAERTAEENEAFNAYTDELYVKMLLDEEAGGPQ